VNAPDAYGVTVLAADGDSRAARLVGKGREQRRRRADHQVGLSGKGSGAGHDFFELAGRAQNPVHLPIARDQRAALRCGHPSPFICTHFSSRNRARKAAPEAV